MSYRLSRPADITIRDLSRRAAQDASDAARDHYAARGRVVARAVARRGDDGATIIELWLEDDDA